MAITSRPQDKYAFLFTGPTLPRFMTDLQNVFDTLTGYYNYPAGNITIVLGSTPSSMPAFPGATVVNVASLAALDAELTTFASNASGPAAGMPGFSKTAVLYFTGGGDNSTGPSRLLTDGGAATAANTIDAGWLTTRLNAILDCHVNVVMQQGFAGGFSSALTGSTLTEWSFTSACTSSENSFGNSAQGSFFTYGWCKGLKSEVLPAGTPSSGQYADELGPGATEMANHLIALNEAQSFGTEIQGALGFGGLGTPSYVSGGSAQYLGLPDFLIRDGSGAWWESPDIYLTHPNHAEPAGDLYIPDAVGAPGPIFNNTITIDVRNVGTHPVRAYSLGIELFKTGTGPTTDQHTIPDKVPTAGVLRPIRNLADVGTGNPGDLKDIAEWNTPFTTGTTHECIKAEAKLVSGDVDFTWSIVANNFEGQRNTDELALAPLSGDAQNAAMEIKGVKQHEYGIHNRFDEQRRYAVVFPAEYAKAAAAFDLTWFEKTEKGALTPLEVTTGHQSFVTLTIPPRRSRTIVLRAQAKRGAKGAGFRLPFAILVEGRFDEQQEQRRALNVDPRLAAAIVGNNGLALGALAGFTVTLRNAVATIAGTVLDRRNQPVPNARIVVTTVDGLQRTAVTTDARGRYQLANVNPDVYRVVAETDNWRSAAQTVVATDRAPAAVDLRLTEDATPAGTRVKVILDRIRIKRDFEPRIKGKADLQFTSVVVPDFDDAARQVTRLPRKGALIVSDKPGKNEIPLDVTVFDGIVKNDALSITINGKELDLFDADDKLTPYQRSFTGNPEGWAGTYKPADEASDREEMEDWAVWYRIVT